MGLQFDIAIVKNRTSIVAVHFTPGYINRTPYSTTEFFVPILFLPCSQQQEIEINLVIHLQKDD